MLTPEQNELITRTSPGTRGGDLLRRYWQPVALSQELPLGGCPMPVRLLNEDLVLFRDDSGRPGLLGLHCSHRGADLSYGRVEDGGLRCIYHGWLYDVAGRCVEQPAEPAGRDFKDKIRHLAYPCQEAAGLIFAYLGPGEPPLLPPYEFREVPQSHTYATKVYQECNYLQAVEGDIDPTHLAFLHRWEDARGLQADSVGALHDGRLRRALLQQDPSPNFDVEQTAFGIRVAQFRDTGRSDCYLLAVINFLMPNCSAYGSDGDGYTVAWHVPIDDGSSCRYTVLFSRIRPLDPGTLANPELTSDNRLIRNKANRYLQNREEMRTETFSGMGRSFIALDVHVSEGQGPIANRTAEHLSPGDRAIIAARRMILDGIGDLKASREPALVVRSSEDNPLADLDAFAAVVPVATAWREYWDRHWDVIGRPRPQESVRY